MACAEHGQSVRRSDPGTDGGAAAAATYTRAREHRRGDQRRHRGGDRRERAHPRGPRRPRPRRPAAPGARPRRTARHPSQHRRGRLSHARRRRDRRHPGARRHPRRRALAPAPGGIRRRTRRDAPRRRLRHRGALRDLGSGNPDPALIPDLSPALAGAVGRPVLYGEPVIDPDFEAWARSWMAPDVPTGEAVRLTLTSGAVDAIERLLAQALVRDDAVALEDPCFLASIQTVRHAGYRAIPVPVDVEGMTADGLRAALEAGARAVVLTPRAQNPTGASLGAHRAEELRAVLAQHPYVLVIEDDYFSYLSRAPFRSVVGPEHRRWALVRSVSKFLGPDLCLAVNATEPETPDRP